MIVSLSGESSSVPFKNVAEPAYAFTFIYLTKESISFYTYHRIMGRGCKSTTKISLNVSQFIHLYIYYIIYTCVEFPLSLSVSIYVCVVVSRTLNPQVRFIIIARRHKDSTLLENGTHEGLITYHGGFLR